MIKKQFQVYKFMVVFLIVNFIKNLIKKPWMKIAHNMKLKYNGSKTTLNIADNTDNVTIRSRYVTLILHGTITDLYTC